MDDGKKEDKDDDGGWEILRPGVVLFETSMGYVLGYRDVWIEEGTATLL